jgi:hypothetical protein
MRRAEELQNLRYRLAGTENLQTLRRLGDEASALAGIAPEALLFEVADFQDRLASKIERLTTRL